MDIPHQEHWQVALYEEDAGNRNRLHLRTIRGVARDAKIRFRPDRNRGFLNTDQGRQEGPLESDTKVQHTCERSAAHCSSSRLDPHWSAWAQRNRLCPWEMVQQQHPPRCSAPSAPARPRTSADKLHTRPCRPKSVHTAQPSQVGSALMREDPASSTVSRHNPRTPSTPGSC